MKMFRHTHTVSRENSIYYSMPNVRYDGSDNMLKWDAFRFFTPRGTISDSDGCRFFNVMGGQIPLARDETMDKELLIRFSMRNGLEILECKHQTRTGFISSNEADMACDLNIAISCFIPAGKKEEIIINYREIIGI